MIDLFPFSGYIVGVLGLGPHGMVTAQSLKLSGAEVWAWDYDKDRRAHAENEDIPLVDLSTCDAREIISLVIEPDIAHGPQNCDEIVTRVRDAGGEVISDAELLARAQRDAAYLGYTGSGNDDFFSSLMTQVLEVAGKDVELGGVPDKPILKSHPLDLGGMYILHMPPEKLNITVSITFDTAIWLGADPSNSEQMLSDMETIFNRQSMPRTAIISIDDPVSLNIFEKLKAVNEQIIIPVSAKGRIPGGVYIEGSMLIDDIKENATPVMDLGNYESYDSDEKKRSAAIAYTAAQSFGIEGRVAMACLQGY